MSLRIPGTMSRVTRYRDIKNFFCFKKIQLPRDPANT